MAAGDLTSGVAAFAIGAVGGWFFALEPKLDRFLWSVVGVGVVLWVSATSSGVAGPVMFNTNDMHRLEDIGLPFAKAGFAAWGAYLAFVVLGYYIGWVYVNWKKK